MTARFNGAGCAATFATRGDRPMRSDLHDITVIYQHATSMAICVRETEDGPDVWFPKAQVEIEPARGTALTRGALATLTAPERLLIEKGMV